MSRLEETIVSINAVRDAIRKESKSANPILFTVPILSQIAVSLAVIADCIDRVEDEDCVHVVRCNDCKFLTGGKCLFTASPKDFDDYCSLGEKKVTKDGII